MLVVIDVHSLSILMAPFWIDPAFFARDATTVLLAVGSRDSPTQ